MEDAKWQNRFQKLNELVASIGDFSSTDEVTEYKQFIGGCVQTLQGLMHMTPEKKAKDDGSVIMCPSEFFCPISKKIMKDPVVVSSGETYDRESIVEKIKDKKICPISKIEITTTLTPNVLLQEMIMAWTCKNTGGPFELFENKVVAEIQKKKISGYVENINSINPMDRRRAALMLRALTFYNKAHCVHLAYPVTVYNIVKVLVQHEHNDEKFEEDLLYTVFHIAVHEENRGVLCENTMLILFLINGLAHGKPDRIKKICATTTRELSYDRDNQEKLGQSGAVKAFIGVLKRRDSLIQNDAAKSLLYLCETPKNIERILVEGGVELLYEWISSKELVVEVVKLLVKITENALVCLRWRNTNGIRLLFSALKDDDCAMETKLDFLDCLINVCGLDPNSRMDMRRDDDLVAFILELGKSKEHLVKVKARVLMNKRNNRANY